MTGSDELEKRIALLEQSRNELGDQMAHLIELLEASREEIRWLKSELARERGEEPDDA